MAVNNFRQTEIKQFTEEFMRDGFCVLRGHFPKAKMQVWKERFAPLLTAHIEREGNLKNRGAERYYVTLPFEAPFADEEILADPLILAIVENWSARFYDGAARYGHAAFRLRLSGHSSRRAAAFSRDRQGNAAFSTGSEFSTRRRGGGKRSFRGRARNAYVGRRKRA
jgi:hypothetical protein